MRQRSSNPMWWAALIAILFVTVAGVGSFLTSRHIDDTAISTGSSTDPKDANGIQEQQNKPSARGASPTTTGSNTPPTTTGSNVPPASR
jgi:hypothetical protein